jgi:hypothetical protein
MKRRRRLRGEQKEGDWCFLLQVILWDIGLWTLDFGLWNSVSGQVLAPFGFNANSKTTIGRTPTPNAARTLRKKHMQASIGS